MKSPHSKSPTLWPFDELRLGDKTTGYQRAFRPTLSGGIAWRLIESYQRTLRQRPQGISSGFNDSIIWQEIGFGNRPAVFLASHCCRFSIWGYGAPEILEVEPWRSGHFLFLRRSVFLPYSSLGKPIVEEAFKAIVFAWPTRSRKAPR